ncbi:MAG: alpha/beta hydrolase [Candidatus Aminicenantes bacterium]|nr:alpha/beta hydrolase [Candidatus Aminicenantes bacterium]
MRKSKLRFAVTLAVMFGLVPLLSFSQEEPYIVPSPVKLTMKSRFVDQTFEIHVQLPVSLADGSERFPVLYMTDCVGGIIFDDITALLQMGGDIPRFITVGIGYPAENWMAGTILRGRDLTPTKFEPPQMEIVWPVRGITKIEKGKKTGGAAEFLRFLREELQPYIDANYPTIPGDRGYFGDSLGGLFGLYVMFNEPDSFTRYIIGSPSSWWDDEVIMQQAKDFASSGKPLNARVFIAAGALEEQGAEAAKFRMVTNVYRIEKMLRSAEIKGLQLSTFSFPNETHTSVVAMNYIRGVQTVYDRPALPFLQDYMMKQMKEAPAKDKK